MMATSKPRPGTVENTQAQRESERAAEMQKMYLEAAEAHQG